MTRLKMRQQQQTQEAVLSGRHHVSLWGWPWGDHARHGVGRVGGQAAVDTAGRGGRSGLRDERADAVLRERRLHEVSEDLDDHLFALRLRVFRYFDHCASCSLQLSYLVPKTKHSKFYGADTRFYKEN